MHPGGATWPHSALRQRFVNAAPDAMIFLLLGSTGRMYRIAVASACTTPSTTFRQAARMLIIAIAWLYVVVLMAATQPTWLAAIATLMFYGLLPLSIVLYLINTPARRRRQRMRATPLVEPTSEPEERSAGN